jgi:hypothetical protein
MTEGYSDTITTFNNIYQIEKSERFLIGQKTDLETALITFKNFDVEHFIEKANTETKKMEGIMNVLERMHKAQGSK